VFDFEYHPPIETRREAANQLRHRSVLALLAIAHSDVLMAIASGS
jgi:hypothetical protein